MIRSTSWKGKELIPSLRTLFDGVKNVVWVTRQLAQESKGHVAATFLRFSHDRDAKAHWCNQCCYTSYVPLSTPSVLPRPFYCRQDCVQYSPSTHIQRQIDVEILRAAWQIFIERHEVLHFKLVETDTGLQQILSTIRFST